LLQFQDSSAFNQQNFCKSSKQVFPAGTHSTSKTLAVGNYQLSSVMAAEAKILSRVSFNKRAAQEKQEKAAHTLGILV